MIQRSSHRVLTALVLMAVALPVTGQAVFRVDAAESPARSDAAEWRAQRRAYARAVDEYRKRVHAGETDAVMPDINDIETYRAYLAPDAPAYTEPDPKRRNPREGVERYFSSVDELTDRQRLILRRQTRAKNCPPKMEDVFPGFLELCRSMVGEEVTEELPQGLGNESPLVRRPVIEKPTLNLRLEMLRQARDRSNRRPDMFRRPRPTQYMGEGQEYDEALELE